MNGYVPRQGVWEITLACNMRCRHCGSHAGAPREDELDAAEALRVVDELAAAGCERLALSGGEPLLRRDWPAIVEAGARAGIYMKMITNGWLVDDGTACTAKDAGLGALGVSVDGLEETHDFVRRAPGSFRRALDAIRTARAAGLPVAVVTHVNRRNLHELDALGDLLSGEDLYSWQVQLGNPAGELALHRDLAVEPRDLLTIVPAVARLVARDDLEVVPADNIGYFGPQERLLRRNSRYGRACFSGCLGGISHFGLESNGNVKGCLSLPSSRHGRDDNVEGNLRAASFADVWHRPGAFPFTRDFGLARLGGFCRRCEHAALCRGGCRWSMTVNGGGVENPYCLHRVLTTSLQHRASSVMRRVAAAMVAVPTVLVGGACYESGPDEDADVAADAEVWPDDGRDGIEAYGTPERWEMGDVAYGVPDFRDEGTRVDAYGIPDADAYGIPDVRDDAMPADAYGIPDVRDEGTMADAYGIPDVRDEGTMADAYGIPDAAYSLPDAPVEAKYPRRSRRR
jgi:radical SAM protein with 4Fe4S-binding SPASM domain